MFRKLFAARSSRSSAPKCSRRPELEALEDRIPPASAIIGLPPGPFTTGYTYSYGSGYSTTGSQGATSFPSLYLVPFGYSPEAYALASLGGGSPVGLSPSSPTQLNAAQATSASTGGASAGAANQLAQMDQVIGTLFQLSAMQNGTQQTLNLTIDEFFQAADTFVLLQNQSQGASSTSISSIQGYLTSHESAIAQNPADHTPVGQMLGTLVYDATIYMLASNPGSGV